jgi:hypothetical protein
MRLRVGGSGGRSYNEQKSIITPTDAFAAMTKVPLSIRLYTEPHLTALVRLVGYEGLPLPEAKERGQALAEEFGKEKMKAAAREVIHIDTSEDPPLVHLAEAARKVAWQLLGPPPEKAEEFQTRAAWPLPPCA